MGAQLRVYKRRIRSVTATKKITKAMEMIAASRVVKAQRKVAASTPYATELTRAVTAVATGSNTKHPLTTEAETPDPCRGAAHHERPRSGRRLSTPTPSRRRSSSPSGCEARARRSTRTSSAARVSPTTTSASARSRSRGPGFTDSPTYADAKKVAAPLIEAIETGHGRGRRGRAPHRLHRVRLDDDADARSTTGCCRSASTRWRRRPATKGEILPLFDFEPSAEDVLDALLPRYVESRIYNALLQSAASKHAATPPRDEVGDRQRRRAHQERSPGLPTRPARPKSPRKSARSSVAPAPWPTRPRGVTSNDDHC